MPQEQPFWDDRYSVENPGPYRQIGNYNATFMSNAWDTGVIAGAKIPGIVSVTIAPARHLDIKTLPGSSPIVTVLGFEPTRFTMQVKIWTPAQWKVLQPIMWRMFPDLPGYGKPPTPKAQRSATPGSDPNGVTNTFDLFHPKLSNMGVSSATCLKLGDLAGDQVKTLSIEFLANRRGKSKLQTVAESVVVAQFNAAALATQATQPLVGRPTIFTPTQGPQLPPSTAGVSLTPSTP